MSYRTVIAPFIGIALTLPILAFGLCAESVTGRSNDRRAGPDWWSLQPIVRPVIPKTVDSTRTITAIDAFIQAKLEANTLTIATEADRRTLIRRLKFDMHGLPPTPEELDEFVNDTAPDAYDRLVDRLLDSPHYGERWGRHWLDVVRFSESKGYERDRIREHAWRYREWVIRAFNDDKPYRDFVREQIAGDAMHPEDPAGAVPSGFLVTGPNNDVGNQSKLELERERADELDEIVQNVTSVFLGLTVGCARCHDHKFDPVPTADYYRIAAVFSGVKFGDRPLESAADASRHAEQLLAWDRRTKEINQRLGDIRQALEAIGFTELNAKRNDERFEPVDARFVRLTITSTRGDTEPCIDEIEIYGPDLADGSDPAKNLALASRGSKATASSLLPGYPIHQVHHLNDGLTGNDHSWISNERGTGWVQIELPEPSKSGTKISRVVWGRDRDGKFSDRLANEYRLEFSLDGKTFEKLATLADRPPPDSETAAKVTDLKAERKRLQDEKRSIDDGRVAVDRLPKTWAALSTLAVPLKVLKRGDVLTPGDDAPPGALSAIGLRRFGADSDRTNSRESKAAGDGELRRELEHQRGERAAPGPHADTADIGISPDDPDPVRRLKLADWIADPENPLTWRVIVNRVWHYHFGAGLVTTPSDFGFSGSRPSHPELLDWLADEFRSSGGRFKALHRMIVRSAVYRQSSRNGEFGMRNVESREYSSVASAAPNSALRTPHSTDAENRLLWRPNRRRLDAETLRDSILLVSGTLDQTAGGPSYRTFNYIEGNIPVYEPLPESRATFRRTVYRHIIRTHRQPFLDTFDCPDPSVMAPTRTQTTTPLQALSLLNNPFVFDQGREFAVRVTREAGPDTAAQARRAFRIAVLRDPSESESKAATDFIVRHGLESLCRVLFNSNEFLYIE
jgi:hypothetical protein